MSNVMPALAPTSPHAGEQTIDELDAAILEIARNINSQSYRFLLLIREYDDRLGWMRWGYKSCAEWLAWRCGLKVSAAREKVRCAQALRDLPAISAALADGRLSYSKVRALTRATHLADERSLLAYALDATAEQIEERCRQIRNVAPESVDDARRAWERRSLSVWRNRNAGTLTITIEVPIEDGELITHAIERASTNTSAAVVAETAPRSWHAQQADALVNIAKAYLSGGTDEPASNADHYQVVVHVDEKALRGGAGRSDLPIETVRRLTCDCSLVGVVDDARGSPLDVGRKQRTVSTALKRALWSRDRGCSFPGCHHALYVDAHHIRHWGNGGDTKLDNLALLCSDHHRLLHEGGFTMRHDAHGGIYFRRPDGRAIPRSGYRADEVLDDSPGLDEPSAEAWLTAVMQGRNPSAEVREARAIYLVGSAPASNSVSARNGTSSQSGRCSSS